MRYKIIIARALTALAVMGNMGFVSADIKAYPVPWVPEAGREGKIVSGNYTDGITFAGLPSSGDIYIYNINGMLVRRVTFSDPVGGHLRLYGANDSNGGYISSGVYIWKVVGDGISKTGKLIVVR
ncbi:MAG: hypothetical protein A2219_07865 [Elusimicrobia bacterium RIFOXYA2_FULL_50_26]|nr:MAG: hypothetical protein A2219_07865 [Elusimicrobia bacterium RIFOXYA2_FULL_50_26]OGS22359.1 MAG: hypothetical protein A2314_08265 [Elusimicrobia bacterium RIFOXYB2_FULL_50_12]